MGTLMVEKRIGKNVSRVTLPIFLFWCLFLFPLSAFADVRINEVAWMGTEESASHEWIELYNTGEKSVDLSGWSLVASDGSPEISFSGSELTDGSIPAGGYFILERTSDESVPSVTANLIYTGALANDGEVLTLRDAEGHEVQTLDASSGWPAGDNTTKNTMSWSEDSGGWITAKPTPGEENSTVDLSEDEDKDQEDDGSSTKDTKDSKGQGKDISTHAGTTPLSNKKFPQEIFVDAGRDRAGVPDSPLVFTGTAFDKHKSEVRHVRFSWTFGDGTSRSGKTVKHAYDYPGDYNVVLRARSSKNKAVDRLRVFIHDTKISITDTKSGKSGFVEISNTSDSEINLGGYTLLRGDVRFKFPKDTIISGKTKIRFTNLVTGLTSKKVEEVTLRSPMGSTLVKTEPEEATTTRVATTTKILKVKKKLRVLQSALIKKKKSSQKFPSLSSQGIRTPSRSKRVQKSSPSVKNVVHKKIQRSTKKVNKKNQTENSQSKKETASAHDSVVVIEKKDESLWGKVTHFFTHLGW